MSIKEGECISLRISQYSTLLPSSIPSNLALDNVAEQTAEQKAEDIEEVVLDSIKFQKFNAELKTKLGMTLLPLELTP